MRRGPGSGRARRRTRRAAGGRWLRHLLLALPVGGLWAAGGAGALASVSTSASAFLSVEERVAVTVVNNSPMLALVLASAGSLESPIATLAAPVRATAPGELPGGIVTSGGALAGDAVSLDTGSDAAGEAGDRVPRVIVQYN